MNIKAIYLPIWIVFLVLLSGCETFWPKEPAQKRDDCTSDYSKLSVSRYAGAEGENENLEAFAGIKMVTEYVRLQDEYILELKRIESLCRAYRDDPRMTPAQYILALTGHQAKITRIQQVIVELDKAARDNQVSEYPSEEVSANLQARINDAKDQLIQDLERIASNNETGNLGEEVDAIKNHERSTGESNIASVEVITSTLELERQFKSYLLELNRIEVQVRQQTQLLTIKQNELDQKLKAQKHTMDLLNSEIETVDKDRIKATNQLLNQTNDISTEVAENLGRLRSLNFFACQIARSFNDPALWELCSAGGNNAQQ